MFYNDQLRNRRKLVTEVTHRIIPLLPAPSLTAVRKSEEDCRKRSDGMNQMISGAIGSTIEGTRRSEVDIIIEGGVRGYRPMN